MALRALFVIRETTEGLRDLVWRKLDGLGLSPEKLKNTYEDELDDMLAADPEIKRLHVKHADDDAYYEEFFKYVVDWYRSKTRSAISSRFKRV